MEANCVQRPFCASEKLYGIHTKRGPQEEVLPAGPVA